MPGAQRRERKVVTAVFCDLVGFTARAESMDPEDVEALLRPYHERVRSELERHGGTVEKFIGDAVMALFGAPTAHEDDPERAVRAALAIREFALEEELELRVGVTTGEALVRLDISPGAGEGMASGDVVNTAARLQSAAPVNGILVDETTYRATRGAVDYEPVEPVTAKGKSDPIGVWMATAAHSRFGVDTAHEARSELVGRERELGVVRDAFERARHERTPQLLTLVGVPGIGKSRLVYELNRIVEADPELITWRQGRCLAYGDGITLWALGEIVKAQAGVLEQDTPEDIIGKIRQTVEDTLAGTGDEARVETHLLALLGLAGETQLGGDRRNESFAAWRRFLEGLAEQRPLVIVVEDIHWADESLLDFLDELVDWVTDVPLLVVSTARPELLERRPDWGGGKLNATTLALSPLSEQQTGELITRLLGKPVLTADAQRVLLDRAGGNPLYAEQFVELYTEQGSTDELALPETLQGIISARLDGLPESEKSLLQDAAVVGKVFWASSIGREPDATTASLHALERKGFVRRQRRSSLEGESEFAFAHALVRDVSYGQIPRADRAERHRAVAEWIDGLGRREDHAEMLAYHWSSALELVRASGAEDDGVADQARHALRDAGDRAFALHNFAVASEQYEDALALWPEDDTERSELLFSRARALFYAYDDRRAEALKSARDALLSAGQRDRAAEAEAFLANAAFDRGHGEATHQHVARAVELADDTVSPSTARVLATAARITLIAGDVDGGLATGEAALAMAERLGLDELRAHALTTTGMAKEATGDASGRAEMQRALDLALEIDSPIAAAIAGNLGIQFMHDGDLERAGSLWNEGARISERFGNTELRRFVSAPLLGLDYWLGRWDRALESADQFLRACEAGSEHTNEWLVRITRAEIREARGDPNGALADFERGVAAAREVGNPIYLAETLSHCSAAYAARGSDAQGTTMLREATELIRRHGMPSGVALSGLYASRFGLDDEVRKAIEETPGTEFRGWKDAFLAALAGDLRGAADRFAAMPNLAFEARMRLEAGARLVEHDRRDEGEAELAKTLDFYRSVDATAYVERAERLLADAHRASA